MVIVSQLRKQITDGIFDRIERVKWACGCQDAAAQFLVSYVTH
jgi:hypothetical protein